MKTNKSQKNISNGWKYVELADVLDYEQPQAYLVSSENYDNKYTTPVLTAGKTFILGYTDEDHGIFSEELPVIIFDDFTAAHKFVDFPFKAKSSAMKILKAKNEVNIKFIFGWMQINSFAIGEHKRHYLSEYQYQDVLLPPLPEQNCIVSVLETWDKAIEKLAKKIEFKKNIKKGLMQRLLAGKLRLPGFLGKWKTVKLGNVSEFINGFTFRSSTYCEDGKYKVITIANVQDGFMFIDESKLVNELPLNISKEQILEKGDILISMTGNVGRVCTVNTNNCLLNQRVGKIVPRDINKDLLYLFLHDRRFLNKMIDGAQGGAQDNLSTGDIKEYIFDIPKSKEEQTAIANILMAANKEICLCEQKLKQLKKQKNYLLNNLVTGAIRTPENLLIK